jgi:hypothetical protein
LILLKQYSSDKNIKSAGLVFFYCSNMDPTARSDQSNVFWAESSSVRQNLVVSEKKLTLARCS